MYEDIVDCKICNNTGYHQDKLTGWSLICDCTFKKAGLGRKPVICDGFNINCVGYYHDDK